MAMCGCTRLAQPYATLCCLCCSPVCCVPCQVAQAYLSCPQGCPHTPLVCAVCHPGGQQGPKEFQAEVAILSRLHHPHIVLLIGSCPERCALVYELMDYGSLEQHLFNPGLPELAWQVGGWWGNNSAVVLGQVGFGCKLWGEQRGLLEGY